MTNRERAEKTAREICEGHMIAFQSWMADIIERAYLNSCTLTVSSDPAEKVKSNKANEIDPQQR